MSSADRDYTSVFQSYSVDLVVTSGRPVADIAQDLRVRERTLEAWVELANSREEGNKQRPEPIEDPASTSNENSAPDNAGPETAPSANDLLLQAVDLGLGEVPGSVLYAVESEDGGARWEISVIALDGSCHEVETSADGSRVLKGPTKKGTDPKYLQRAKAATVPHVEIIDAALSQVPGTIVELDLDTEDGRVVWEIEVLDAQGVSTELDIDAATGEVLESSR